MLSPSTSSKLHRTMLNVLGVLYLAVGVFALYNAFIFWKLAAAAPAMLAVYGILYIALAYLFFTKQRWILWIAALNLFANILLWGYRAYAASGLPTAGMAVIAINALLVWYLWSIRHTLRDSTAGRVAAAAALGLWGVVLYSAILTVI